MKKKLTGLNAGGFAHPEIRPGDKWKDNRGCLVTVESYRFNKSDVYSGWLFREMYFARHSLRKGVYFGKTANI